MQPSHAVWHWAHTFGAFCLDVRILIFCQLLKVKLVAGEQKATEKQQARDAVSLPCNRGRRVRLEDYEVLRHRHLGS